MAYFMSSLCPKHNKHDEHNQTLEEAQMALLRVADFVNTTMADCPADKYFKQRTEEEDCVLVDMIPEFEEEFRRDQLGLETVQTRLATALTKALVSGELAKAAKKVVPSDVERWRVKEGEDMGMVGKMAMMIPALAHISFLGVGGAIAASGYMLGKGTAAIRGGKLADSKVFQTGLRAFLYAQGIWPTVEYESLGDADAKEEPDMCLTPIIVPNHVSYIDGPLLFALFGCPRIIAKADTRQIPIVGPLMKEMDTVFVERDVADSREATKKAIADHCASWKAGDRPMVIFPEATTTSGTEIKDFKAGSFAPATPVRPVVITYTGPWDPSNTRYKVTDDGMRKTGDAEWGQEFLSNFNHSVHVKVLRPYLPSEEEKTDAKLYATNVQKVMSEELARQRKKHENKSWKHSAGRSDGGMGYKFGDLSRTIIHALRGA